MLFRRQSVLFGDHMAPNGFDLVALAYFPSTRCFVKARPPAPAPAPARRGYDGGASRRKVRPALRRGRMGRMSLAHFATIETSCAAAYRPRAAPSRRAAKGLSQRHGRLCALRKTRARAPSFAAP